MSNVNTVAVSGNLVRDPELRQAGQSQVCSLRIAVNRSRKNDAGGYDEVASFFSVDVWGNFGELVNRKLRQGDKVTVQGRLEQQQWEQEGVKREKVIIVANDLDGEGFYRKDSEVPVRTDNGLSQHGQQQLAGAAAAETATAAAGGSGQLSPDDDIPF